jgi:hypothetical protein
LILDIIATNLYITIINRKKKEKSLRLFGSCCQGLKKETRKIFERESLQVKQKFITYNLKQLKEKRKRYSDATHPIQKRQKDMNSQFYINKTEVLH